MRTLLLAGLAIVLSASVLKAQEGPRPENSEIRRLEQEIARMRFQLRHLTAEVERIKQRIPAQQGPQQGRGPGREGGFGVPPGPQGGPMGPGPQSGGGFASRFGSGPGPQQPGSGNEFGGFARGFGGGFGGGFGPGTGPGPGGFGATAGFGRGGFAGGGFGFGGAGGFGGFSGSQARSHGRPMSGAAAISTSPASGMDDLNRKLDRIIEELQAMRQQMRR